MNPEPYWLAALGLALFGGLMTGVPVLLAIAGVPLLVALAASLAGAFDPTFLQAYPQRVFGVMNNTILIAVPLFVTMGVLLERSRIAERMLVRISGALGGSTGTLALAVLAVSTLVAASTGIIGATVVMLGLIALPALLRSGASPREASGVICAAGTLGQIIPPSMVLILLGDQISNAHVEAQREIGNFAPDPVTVSDLFAGALLPGLLLVLLYGIHIAATIGFRRKGPSPVGSATGPEAAKAVPAGGSLLVDALAPILLIVSVLGSILVGVATPTEAASVGVAGTLLLAAASQGEGRGLRLALGLAAAAAFALAALKIGGLTRSSAGGGLSLAGAMSVGCAAALFAGLGLAMAALWRKRVLQAVLGESLQVTAMIFGIILATSLLSLVFRGFGGDELVEGMLTGLPGGPHGMLLATMVVIFALGFVLEFVEIVFIVIPIVGPILLASEIDPVWLAVLVALNLQTSFLTPPFGFALFYFRSVAPESVSTADIYRSIIPYVAIQIIAIGIVYSVPELALWLPTVLFP